MERISQNILTVFVLNILKSDLQFNQTNPFSFNYLKPKFPKTTTFTQKILNLCSMLHAVISFYYFIFKSLRNSFKILLEREFLVPNINPYFCSVTLSLQGHFSTRKISNFMF